MAYSLDTRKKARDLYVQSGLSYEEVARITGVSVNNLKKWGKKDKWATQRDDFVLIVVSREGTIQGLQNTILDQFAEAVVDKNLDPQRGYFLDRAFRTVFIYSIVVSSPQRLALLERAERLLKLAQKTDRKVIAKLTLAETNKAHKTEEGNAPAGDAFEGKLASYMVVDHQSVGILQRVRRLREKLKAIGRRR